MPRKKKESLADGIKLKFTGKMSVLIELEGFGPMQWRVNDFDTTMKVVKVILDETDNKSTFVDSYDKKEQKTFEKILGEIE